MTHLQLNQENEVFESLFFVIGLLTSIRFDAQDVKDTSEDIKPIAIKHYQRLLNYHGSNKNLVEGRSEALKHLASLETFFPGINEEVVSHTPKPIG